jgi:hypothetical protein
MHAKDKFTVALLLIVLIICIQSFLDTASKVYHDAWVIPITFGNSIKFLLELVPTVAMLLK